MPKLKAVPERPDGLKFLRLQTGTVWEMEPDEHGTFVPTGVTPDKKTAQRGRAVVARRAHNSQVAGSTPAPATIPVIPRCQPTMTPMRQHPVHEFLTGFTSTVDLLERAAKRLRRYGVRHG
jgi:hypothetical protein